MNALAIIALLLSHWATIPKAATPASAGNYLEIGGSKIWYEQCVPSDPHAPAVVLLHDGLVHSISWDSVWAPLCSRYRVLRYDRRGYGRSEPTKARYLPEDDLATLLRHVGISRAILVGNSSGAGLALDFTIAHPEMVEGLFLIGPVVHGMATSDYFNDRGSRNSAPLQHGDVKAAAENWSKDRFLIAGDDPAARKKLYDALLQAPQNVSVTGNLEIRPSPPTSTRLSEIRVPAHVLVGEADIADVFAYSGAIEAAVPLSSFVVLKDAGHLIQIQRPAEMVERFNRFVSLTERREVNLNDAQLMPYVGRYNLFDRPATVSLRDHRLVLEFPGDPYYWLFPASDSKFFLRTEETEIEFLKNASGAPTEIVIHNYDGNVFRGPRLP